jgi:metallo-beta-lactamase class B
LTTPRVSNKVRCMNRKHTHWLALLGLLGAASAANLVADAPLACDQCAGWNQPQEPFQVWSDTWYVGTKGLSAILITSKGGHILIDGGLPQSAPLIAANIAKAGFQLEDVKLILNSHTHYDHAGGIAALQRASGAQVAASPASKRALERGGPTEDDPQFGFGAAHNDYAPVHDVRVVKDGETLEVGPLRITAHFTSGHTPGGTTWTWMDCQMDNCMPVVYADSLNSISAPGFRFTGDPARVAAFEKSIATVAGLDCGILLAPHPELFDRDAKLAYRRDKHYFNSFFGRAACRNYAEGAHQRLDQRLADERKQAGTAN